MNPLSRTPVLSLLIPLLVGILIQYYFRIAGYAILLFTAGVGVMLFSYFINPSWRYRFRWLFGVGVMVFVTGIGIVSTHNRQLASENIVDPDRRLYRGIVANIPQDKPRSTAYKTYLPDYDKQVVCYFQLDTLGDKLQPGDEFLFEASIQSFRNMDGSDFDYVTYMHNQGFAGSAYVSNTAWMRTGEVSSSPKIIAQRLRQQILNFYRTLGFDETEFSILAALTVGYQDGMSDDLKQSFRTTGTVHVLSVSGLHVGIIYLMITCCLGFIRRSSRFYKLKPLAVILLLWVYAFITGLSPSVTRASLMITALCIGELFDRRSYSIHALYIAAFFILLHNPFSLFHISFQLSFLSVLSILYLHPKLRNLVRFKNKIANYIWSAFLLSCAAQLATFPLCLYYFGTFPTYFFITNLLVVPLISVIMYAFGLIILAKGLSCIFVGWNDYLFFVPVKILQFLLKALTECIGFFEQLPFALVSDAKISLWQLLLLFAFGLAVLFCCHRKGLFVKEYQKY